MSDSYYPRHGGEQGAGSEDLHIAWLEDRIDVLTRERDEARAEVEKLRASIENLDSLYVSRTDSLREYEAALRTAGIRLETLKHQLTEHQYQELASVLFDLPLVTEGDK